MVKQEIGRLIDIEKRIKDMAKEMGLLTTDILFEIVSAQKVLEGMSYMFPVNYSHWTFGRDYERNRTIYENTGSGIPYEQVWNFDVPRAYLVETNPFALNVLILAHVYGHVDYFLANRYLQHGRSFSNVAEEARNAAIRFQKYEERYSQKEVEKVIDAGMSIMWHQNPDPFFEEQDEEVVRERLVDLERAKLERTHDIRSEFKKTETQGEIEKIERRLEHLLAKTPPEPNYDLLNYIIKRSPKPLKPWMIDVLTVVRNQARCLAPNQRTKGGNEGWATYCHIRMVNQLHKEGLLTSDEHGTANKFHSGVTRELKHSFNWYRIYLALLENIKERWDKGRFGKEYEEEQDHHKRSVWDTKANLGDQKVLQVRALYSDRMLVEEFFTDDFIREQQIYIWMGIPHDDGSVDYIIAEDDPAVIREEIKQMCTHYGLPQIIVENGNFNGQGHLLLKHVWTGFELDRPYMNATLEKIHYLWGKKVFLEIMMDGKKQAISYDYQNKNGKNGKK